MKIIWCDTTKIALRHMFEIQNNRLKNALIVFPYNLTYKELQSPCDKYESLCIQRNDCICGNIISKDAFVIRCNPLQPLEMRKIIETYQPYGIAFGSKIVELKPPFVALT
jgi:hypothetical protein